MGEGVCPVMDYAGGYAQKGRSYLKGHGFYELKGQENHQLELQIV